MKWNADVMKTIAIAFVVTIALAALLRCIMMKREEPSSQTEIQVTEEAPVMTEEEEEKENFGQVASPGNGIDRGSSEKKVNSYNCVQIEKIYTVITDDGKENMDMDYTKYYLSDVNLNDYTDKTSDYSEAIGMDAFDDDKIKSIEFSDAFGFSYEACSNPSEFFESARKGSGFDADLTDATYDEEKYSLNKEESYEFNGYCSILYTLLGDMDYDELLQSKCYYSLSKGEDGAKYPVMFTAIVQYKTGDVITTKTAYLGFSYYHEGENGGCGCAEESGSDSSSCSSDMDCGSDCSSCGDEETACPSCGGIGECKANCEGACCK